jgi:hypothetical protein
MNLNQYYLKQNNCYKAGKSMVPKGIMIHSTGANNTSLKRYVGPEDGKLGINQYSNHWNQPTPDGESKSPHAFIGKLADGSIATYQTLPWDMRGWHAGGTANDTHVGFEICEDALIDKEYFALVYREAVELCAYLCKLYSIHPDKPSLICHSEGYALGLASNHGDVMHWFVKHGKNMDMFRADVRTEMEGKEVGKKEMEIAYYNDLYEIPDFGKATVEKLVRLGYLKGDKTGDINLSYDMLRLLVINDRAGLYDREAKCNE